MMKTNNYRIIQNDKILIRYYDDVEGYTYRFATEEERQKCYDSDDIFTKTEAKKLIKKYGGTLTK